jgi:hypothetical protein
MEKFNILFSIIIARYDAYRTFFGLIHVTRCAYSYTLKIIKKILNKSKIKFENKN